MRWFISLHILIYSILFFFSFPLFALDNTIEKLDISGVLRMRFWYTGSQTMVPSKFPSSDGVSTLDYQDIFFRNRFSLKILPELEVRAVFDIGAIFGKNDFSLGSGKTNLITRDVYAVFKPTEESELSVGLQPFSFQGGYILARDASGIQYTQHLFNRNVKVYAGFIKAFDDADTAYNDEVSPPRYADDNIYFLGSTLSVLSLFFADIYYIFEHDRYTEKDSVGAYTDQRTASLSWAAFHGKLIFQNWIMRAGGIFNWGEFYLQNNTSAGHTDVRAFLGEIELGYRGSNFQISLVGEGASGDINNPNDAHSFQVIKSSHEFSYIAVDNFGGISLRASGESSWYGLSGMGIKIQYTLWEAISIETRFLHFRKSDFTKSASEGHFGDEIDFRMEYVYREILPIFLAAAVFRPGKSYYDLPTVDDDRRGIIFEIMLGAQLNY